MTRSTKTGKGKSSNVKSKTQKNTITRLGQVKFIVSSDAHDVKHLEALLESLEEAAFDKWQDVVVVRGNAHSSTSYSPETLYGTRGVRYLDHTLSNQGLHWLAALYGVAHRSTFNATAYFYANDTCVLERRGEGFVEQVNSFSMIFSSMKNIGKDDLLLTSPYSESFVVFGRSVVEQFGQVYETRAGKTLIDGNGCQHNICSLRHYAKNVTKVSIQGKSHWALGGYRCSLQNQTGLVQHSTFTRCRTSRQEKKIIKLVINSDARYSKALEKLFQSLEGVNFERWQDVIVVRGSSPFKAVYHPNTSYGDLGVTYVDLTWMNYDFHGFAALHSERRNRCVWAHVYFYIHDTCTAGPKFPQVFDSMLKVASNEIVYPGQYQSNICAFGRGLVQVYKGLYEKIMTKRDGITVESGWCWGHVCPMFMYAAKVTIVKARITTGRKVDLYNTGVNRTETYYEDFGLYKYLLVNKQGDLTGNLRSY